jgi:amino acid transporter
MIAELKRWFVGRPLENELLAHERLSKRSALAIFASDALSSVAYATEAMLIALLAAGTLALQYAPGIAIAIVVLLLIVTSSYLQTIKAYPNGGGAYMVSRENLGMVPSLLAAVPLLISYILTVAVSMSAAVAALVSAVHVLEAYRVELALILISIVTLINLRGTKESARVFALPTYIFLASMFFMLAIGFFRWLVGDVQPAPMPDTINMPTTLQPITMILLLHAFAAGCSAMTGIEAISDGVPAFKQPSAKNASRTLIAMALILSTLFLGMTFLTSVYEVVPAGGNEPETASSQLARAIFGENSPLYYILQVSTVLILVLASNTAYADFPRLTYFLALDRFLPRRFAQRGDRLVLSNGILLLGGISALLVIGFGAREQALLPLYAIGVFIAFTLSQAGMVVHQWRKREQHWQIQIVLSALGACVTAIVMLVVGFTRFFEGAWMVIVLIPLVIMMMLSIHKHYTSLAKQLSLEDAPPPLAVQRHTAIVLISGVHRGVIPALQYAQSLAPDNVTAVYVDLDPEVTQKIAQKWEHWGCGIPLKVLPSPYRSLLDPLMKYIDEVDKRYNNDVLTIILPEFVPARWWHYMLHNQTAITIKAALLFRKGKTVLSVPYRLRD